MPDRQPIEQLLAECWRLSFKPCPLTGADASAALALLDTLVNGPAAVYVTPTELSMCWALKAWVAWPNCEAHRLALQHSVRACAKASAQLAPPNSRAANVDFWLQGNGEHGHDGQ